MVLSDQSRQKERLIKRERERMQWFLLVFISLISFRVHVYGAAVPEKKLQHAAEVVGSVFCDTCLQHQFSKTSHFISGASVFVECPNGMSKEAKTDGSGRFRARLPFSVGENGNEIRNCTVQLMSSSEPKCSVSSIRSSSSLQLKSSGEGIHIFAAGFLAFKPLKLPRICRKLNDKEIKIPIPSSSGDQTSTNPKHKKLSESSSTSFSRPGSDQERTTSNFPELIFPPFPFQPPPLFPPIPGFTPPPLIPLPPIPGFTPPPLIPLPPIPGFTPPPPLIPLPPIPGFTPPSPPPFIPLPPIPFPGLTPPPPPPWFPLPPIPGFTPPPPPPSPFIPIPLPPIPFPGFTPPPPPPPPPPAFPFPFPPLPFPPLPPSPGRPPASPSPDKSRTNP